MLFVDRPTLRETKSVLHNLPAGDWAAGERGIAILPDRVDAFRYGVARAIQLKYGQPNCLVDIAPAHADVVDLNEVLVGNLRFAADALAKVRIKLLIEPIDNIDIPGFFLSKTAQALQLIANEPGTVKSTIPSCSAISTLLVITAGSGANTSRGRRRSKASAGTPH